MSDAGGRVLIESPEVPRGLWVTLTDEAGRGLTGIQVEYESLPNRLVSFRFADPSGQRQETLLWTQSAGGHHIIDMGLRQPVDMAPGFTPVGLRIGPNLLEPDGPQFTSWEDLTTYLQERRQDGMEQAIVEIDRSTALAVDLTDAKPLGRLVEYMEDQVRTSWGKMDTSLFQVLLSPHVFKRDFALFEGAIVFTTFILIPGSELEKWILDGREFWREGPVTWWEAAGRKSISLHDSDEELNLNLLAALPNLKRLGLSENDIVDLSPLAALTNLEKLYLRTNDIVDVGPLASLTNLELLDLRNNDIVDIGPLAGLANLNTLRLNRNDIVDVSSLASLTNLEALNLGLNDIVDVSPLASLTNLEALNLGANDIVDVSPLAGLTNLGELTLSNNEIVDLSPLAGLTNLHVLDLKDNQIVDLSPLTSLTGLRWLLLQRNSIQDIRPLVANTGLEGRLDHVRLEGNPLSDRAINKQIPALRARGVTVHH